MKFQTDRQTLIDLGIFSSVKGQPSVFDLFNKTKSLLGKEQLLYYLDHPLSDPVELNKRKDAIYFFKNLTCRHDLNINKNDLDFIEHYLSHEFYPAKPLSKFRVLYKSLKQKFGPTNEYYIIERGIDYILDLLNNLYSFSTILAEYPCPEIIEKNNTFILELFKQPQFKSALKIKEMQKLNPFSIATFDYNFRFIDKDVIRKLLSIIYDYDVFITVAQIATDKGFSFPEVLPAQESIYEIEDTYNPFITAPIKNSVSFSSSKNLTFITGPNMAGKSALLKTLGIVAYLAHVGFPVPASKCRISILSGLFTTINLSDNISLGYSHFYAEVARIKMIAEKLKENSNMLIVFDELFRGTNIKDAHDGSLAIISAFSKINTCFFAISTHIIEVAENMNNLNYNGICFKQMDVIEKDNAFEYTYQLIDGISDKRLGMHIIEKEKIIDIINSAAVL